MKTCPVLYTHNAQIDMDTILLNIAEQSQNGETAVHFIARLDAQCQKLGMMPNGGVRRPELGKDVRLFPFEDKAMILYRVIDETVEITNIFYRGRDYYQFS